MLPMELTSGPEFLGVGAELDDEEDLYDQPTRPLAPVAFETYPSRSMSLRFSTSLSSFALTKYAS